MSAGRQVARAIDALRRGWPVVIDDTPFLAIETADAASLAAFDAGGPADLLISGNRGVTLKLANQRDGTPTGPIRIRRAPWIGIEDAIAIADPALDLRRPLKGPFLTDTLDSEAPSQAALRLARLAGLLPAFFIGGSAPEADALAADTVLGFSEAESLAVASRARLPTRFAEHGEIVAFRSDLDSTEHVALLIGEPGEAPPLVRVHSECLTGDVLGSLKCDCGPQLQAAIKAIAASGWGILLYLRQEGRGIGIANKIAAYALQDAGLDTVDANLHLGFDDDLRRYDVAVAMLRCLEIRLVELHTNNPSKLEALRREGIAVARRVPLLAVVRDENRFYLATKRTRSGHWLDVDD